MSEEREFSELLSRSFSPVETLTPAQVSGLYAHYALLCRWNRVLNLTSIRKLEEAVVRHYCESLFLGSRLPQGGISVLDVGSGAGFPGIPVAVLRPGAQVVLAESHQRKAVFLKDATRGRPNVRVEAVRAESIDTRFDWVISRAVQWKDIIGLVQDRVALLMGAEDAEAAVRSGGFQWNPPIPLPWGRRRVLLTGQRPHR